MSQTSKPLVGIIMGSASDLEIMKGASDILKEFGIGCEVSVLSAHRTPELVADYIGSAVSRGLKVIIAGAGGAAHLAGVAAAFTPLPVIGVPIKSSNSIDGWDSILSMLQMPNGVPVACVALNASQNAGLLAAQIISTADQSIQDKFVAYKAKMKEKIIKANKELAGR